MNKSVFFLAITVLLVLVACKSQAPNAAEEISTSELDSATAELDQLDADLNEAEFEDLEAELSEVEDLELG